MKRVILLIVIGFMVVSCDNSDSKPRADVLVQQQTEPNGLFKPEGLSATWLIMIDTETKEPRPVYLEPEIIVSPFKLH